MQKLPVVIHIPHSSRFVPSECRADILLSPAELDVELRQMTDAYTEEAATGNWAEEVVIAPVSRLVVDVERFRSDSNEEMSRVGMGAVYEKTQSGQRLRSISAVVREAMLCQYYDPHHAEFSQSVSKLLDRFRSCLIIDVHSFPSRPLPYEKDQASDRPAICIGTDQYHTTRHLANEAIQFFESSGFRVEENRPFAGSIVPLSYYGHNNHVYSVMVEINRALIMDESTGVRKPSSSQIFELFPAFAEKLLAVL